MSGECILVTGASGLLGGDVLQVLAGPAPADTTFLALSHSGSQRPQPEEMLGSTQIHWLAGDVARPQLGLTKAQYRELQRDVTGILHAAAITRFSVSQPEAHRTNVLGTAHLLELAALAPRLERFAFVSTVHVAGRRTGRIVEPELEHDAGFVNWYEWSKYEAERLVRAAPVPWAVYRTSTIIGDDATGRIRQHNAVHQAVSLYYHGLAPMLPALPETVVDVIPDRFAAQAVAYLFEHFTSGATYHVCAGVERSLTIRQLLDLTRQTLEELHPEWARRGIEPPDLVDEATFALFTRTARELGNQVFVQAAEAMEHFVPQLGLPKSFDHELADRLLIPGGIEPPALPDYWPRIVASCIDRGRRPAADAG